MERSFLTEIAAKQQRRVAIENGDEVTLIAYDPERGLYIWDNLSL